MNRLLTRVADSSGVTVYSATYAYDLANNRRTIEEFVADQGTRNLAYAYDDQYRLTQEAWDTTSYDYEYDLAGNRTKLTHTVDGIPSVTDYSYDLLNQLNTATKDATSFTTYAYDLNGNQSTKTVDGSVSTYTWDTLDRLVHVDADGTTIFQADYDYRTRRLTKTEGTDVTYFRYDQGNSFQEVKNGTLDAEFIRGSGMGGGIGSILYKDDTTQDEFFVYNAVGHTVVLTDGAGVTKSSNQYEAFGGITGESGASENNRLANTKERDASTGLDNHGFRYYDSATGRYISRDPIGYAAGDMVVYRYVSSDPINNVDPLGLAPAKKSTPSDTLMRRLERENPQAFESLNRQFGGGTTLKATPGPRTMSRSGGQSQGGTSTQTLPGGSWTPKQGNQQGQQANTPTKALKEKATQQQQAIQNAQNGSSSKAASTKTKPGTGKPGAAGIGHSNPESKAYSNPNDRPKYAKGQVEEVWEKAKGPDGKVRDPNTGKVLTWDRSKPRKGQWDMGHKKGHEYRKLHKDYMDGKISQKQFLQQYKNSANYQPEDPMENQGHKHEAK